MHIEKVEFLKSVFEPFSFPKKSFPSVAFAGRSNVGKSSLINRLLGRKEIARVSSKPGKTVCINYFVVNNRYYFVDLPGYGYARVPRKTRATWKNLIERFIQNNDQLKCIVVIIDIRIGIDKKDKMLTEWLSELKIPFIIAATKSDKLSNMNINKNIEAIRKEIEDNIPLIPFSTMNDRWTSTLMGEIKKYLIDS